MDGAYAFLTTDDQVSKMEVNITAYYHTMDGVTYGVNYIHVFHIF